MPRYKCTNPECPEFNKEVIVASIKYRYDKFTDKMVPFDPLICKECHKELEYIENEGEINVTIGKFSSMSSDEKRQAIRKRSQDHFRRNDKGDLANYKKKIVEDNRKRALGNG